MAYARRSQLRPGGSSTYPDPLVGPLSGGRSSASGPHTGGMVPLPNPVLRALWGNGPGCRGSSDANSGLGSGSWKGRRRRR